MADTALESESMDISKLKVPELKRELKNRGLSTSGNKTELMERLSAALKTKLDDTGSAESVDDLDDDLLNDDELDHEPLDASESVLKEIDEQLVTAPSPNTHKRKLSEEKTPSETEVKPVKKVVLNREPSVIEPTPKEEGENEENSSDTNAQDSDAKEEKKVIKFSELSAKERLEMRAKKFGAPLTFEAKKLVRAERFGGAGGSTKISSSEPASLEALKKRAERFGGSVSKVMSNLEYQERLEQRKARFGVAAVAHSNGLSQSEKQKQRTERFKTPIK